MFSAIKHLYSYRHVLQATTLQDLRAKYTGTALGGIWSVLYPILFLSLYATVYMYILKINLEGLSPFDYVLVIFSGLIPFLGFAEALGSGVGSVTANAGLVKNTLFPIELIPLKAVLVSSVTMIVGLVLLLSILWGKGIILATQWLVPVIFLLQLIFTCGLIWLLAAINVFFRDVNQMISIIILFLMLVSPIGYTASMIPENMMPLMYPNPLYYLIMLYRACITENVVPWDMLLVFSGFAIGFFVVGYYVFTRLKVIFVDYV